MNKCPQCRFFVDVGGKSCPKIAIQCFNCDTWEPKVKDNGWKRFYDEMPESGRNFFVTKGTKETTSLFICPDLLGIDMIKRDKDGFTHWQYAVVPEPPEVEIKKTIEKINILQAEGCEGKKIIFAKETSVEVAKKLNEVIDAINSMRGDK